MDTKKRSLTQYAAIRLKARYMVIVQGHTQKDVSKILSVSEKTLSEWSNRYNWKSANDKMINRKGGFEAIMEGFFQFMESTTNKQTSLKTKAVWCNYLIDLEECFNSPAIGE